MAVAAALDEVLLLVRVVAERVEGLDLRACERLAAVVHEREVHAPVRRARKDGARRGGGERGADQHDQDHEHHRQPRRQAAHPAAAGRSGLERTLTRRRAHVAAAASSSRSRRRSSSSERLSIPTKSTASATARTTDCSIIMIAPPAFWSSIGDRPQIRGTDA